MEVRTVTMPRPIPAPPVYFAPRARGELIPDGRLDKDFWKDVPFTSDFVDISGPDFPTPRFRTRAKICWDDTYLYIGALLEGSEIWANLTRRDSVIYHDNDFEMFFDPSSSTHSYLELEMNARNCQWDLLLTKPYRDGGRSVTCWDIPGVETAVHIEGRLNDPAADNRYWSVEARIPFAALMETYTGEDTPPDVERCRPPRTAPRLGEFWRVNFSRVHWQVDGRYEKLRDSAGRVLPEDNWVWAPTGLIDIHYPEKWGFVFFTDHGEACSIPDAEQKKLLLREVYYREHAWRDVHGRFTAQLKDLGMEPGALTLEATANLFEVSCPSRQGRVFLRSDGFTGLER